MAVGAGDRRHSIAALLVVATLVAAGAAFSLTRSDSSPPSIWPPFTMVYEVAGPASPGEPAPRIVHRLEFSSFADWKDTVIEAPDIKNRYGTFSRVGEFQQVEAGIFTTYDPTTDTSDSEAVENGVFRVPRGEFIPYPVSVLRYAGFRFRPAATTATLCYQERCEDNAAGVAFTEDGLERVLVNDARAIPLRVGDNFLVRELRIHDATEPAAILRD